MRNAMQKILFIVQSIHPENANQTTRVILITVHFKKFKLHVRVVLVR